MSNASCALIIDQNLIDQNNGYSYSSQQAAYPASNAVDVNRRARVWRSTGYWRIISGSNTLVIRDASGGSDLTATITAGTYASDTLFFAELKAALEAVSDSTFTITRDSTTNAIKITAVLAGAATHFEIRGAAAGSANFAPIIGFALSNLSGALNYTAPVAKIHTEEFFIFDFGFPVSPTALLLFSDRSRPFRISSSATVKLQGNATDSVLAWDTPQVDVTVSVEDQGAGVVNRYGMGGTSSVAGTACRYWKVKVQDTENSYGYVEIGAMVLGTHIVFERGDVVLPLTASNIDLSQRAYSEGGQPVTSARAQAKPMRLQFAGLTKADYDAVMAVYEYFGTHSAFAIILDELAVFSTGLMRWAKLVRMEDGPGEALGNFNNWDLNWSLREDL